MLAQAEMEPGRALGKKTLASQVFNFLPVFPGPDFSFYPDALLVAYTAFQVHIQPVILVSALVP